MNGNRAVLQANEKGHERCYKQAEWKLGGATSMGGAFSKWKGSWAVLKAKGMGVLAVPGANGLGRRHTQMEEALGGAISKRNWPWVVRLANGMANGQGLGRRFKTPFHVLIAPHMTPCHLLLAPPMTLFKLLVVSPIFLSICL